MRAENARLGVETTTRSDLTARSATKPRSSLSIDQRHTARPDRNRLEKIQLPGPRMGSSSSGARLQSVLDQFKGATSFSTENQEYVEQHPITVDRGGVVGRTALEGRLVHIADVLADTEYTYFENQKIAGYRTALGAPLLREGNVLGVIFVAREVVQPFS